ncbi:MAG: cyclic lactone autoinducer peptide [Ruminococcus sp.]|nr:cyclic lactone autoinducer peptide [Ruminococcus sp.]
MEKKFFTVIKKAIKGAAAASCETTSMLGLYQPKTPKALIKADKK